MGESTSMSSSSLWSLSLDSDSSISDDETSSAKGEATNFEALLSLLEDESKDEVTVEVDTDVWVFEDETA
jgi:hypothetical protein